MRSQFLLDTKVHNPRGDAILDRIVHSSHRVELSGPSMRKIKSSIKSDEY